MSTNSGDEPAGVNGWLLLLSRLLIVWQPLNLVRGPAVAIILVVRTMVTAAGVAAGLALSNRHTGAVTLAKVALALSAATDLFVYTTPYFPNNRAPGDTIFYIAASMAYHGIWLMYLFRSRRVRNTY
jgi:hypothetical protein